MSNNIPNIINHIAFIIDKSGSMQSLAAQTISVFDSQIKHLAKRSQELDQETRVSVYLFDTVARCIIFDKDVMRLPSIANFYQPGGGTALIDGADLAIADLKKTAQMYGDHSFLLYVLTDGEENSSRVRPADLSKTINALDDGWTVGVLVPDDQGVRYAQSFGFPVGNIMKWDVSAKGMADLDKNITTVTEQYMVNRSRGIRGSKTLFTFDASNISSRKISDNLDSLTADKFKLVNVTAIDTIKPFVEQVTGSTYVKGSAFYQLTKKEEIQSYKEICVQNKISKRVYSGANARQLLGLPNTTVNVKPENTGNFNIFVQSTSVNRKLVPGTQLLILT